MRDRLASYLNKLIGYGVSGFRVDAAKHVGQADLDAIYSRLHRTADGTRPYWALEVFGGGPGTLSPARVHPQRRRPRASTTSSSCRSAFKSYPADATGSIATLRDFGDRLRADPEPRARCRSCRTTTPSATATP